MEMKYIYLITVLLLTGCNTNNLFSGDYYTTELKDNVCYYNYDNVVFKSRNGTCSFLASTWIGVRSHKESYLVLFEGTGNPSWVYDINKQNVFELSAYLQKFIDWSKLNEQERVKQAEIFNGSSESKSGIAALGETYSYTYVNKSSEPHFTDYKDKPVLMIYNPVKNFGVNDSQVWLMTPKEAERFIVFINRTAQLVLK